MFCNAVSVSGSGPASAGVGAIVELISEGILSEGVLQDSIIALDPCQVAGGIIQIRIEGRGGAGVGVAGVGLCLDSCD